MWNPLRLYLETILLNFCFYGFHRKDYDGLKYICGYFITLYSIILLFIIYKTSCASKFLVWVWGVTQSDMESTESRMASNLHMEDPFLVGKSTANLSHLHSDFVHQFTHADTFQRDIYDIDRDLSRFDLPLAEIKSHEILSENNSPSTSSHNIPKPQHPNITSKPPTMPPTPPTLLFDISNLKVSPQNKVNPTT